VIPPPLSKRKGKRGKKKSWKDEGRHGAESRHRESLAFDNGIRTCWPKTFEFSQFIGRTDVVRHIHRHARALIRAGRRRTSRIDFPRPEELGRETIHFFQCPGLARVSSWRMTAGGPSTLNFLWSSRVVPPAKVFPPVFRWLPPSLFLSCYTFD
jgi:hypothetical protein